MPTIKELHNKIRQHNASNCIKGYSKKKKGNTGADCQQIEDSCTTQAGRCWCRCWCW